jgi:SAM-dependent methyltransferase
MHSKYKQIAREVLPPRVWHLLTTSKHAVTSSVAGVLDFVDDSLGHRNPMVPPRRKIFIGEGDFLAVGNLFLTYFQQLCNLSPDESVLDVGCGIGRMAVALTRYLSAQGSYEGFDIVPDGIAWCSERITPRYPNFRFQVADLFNKSYNSTGKFAPAEYRFPYSDGQFDFVFLTSIFTHMLPEDVSNYLREIRRVLRPSGRALITWFLLNEESNGLIREGRASLNMVHPVGECRTASPRVPEEAIGYPEVRMREMAAAARFSITSIYYGSWCGRERFLSYQDIAVMRPT